MTDEDYMNFGKYGPDNGDRRKMKDIPASYLLWLYDNVLWNSDKPLHQTSRDYIIDSYRALMMDAPDYIPDHPPIDNL